MSSSSVGTKNFSWSREKTGSNLCSLHLRRKEQIWGVAIQYWIDEYKKAEGGHEVLGVSDTSCEYS